MRVCLIVLRQRAPRISTFAVPPCRQKSAIHVVACAARRHIRCIWRPVNFLRFPVPVCIDSSALIQGFSRNLFLKRNRCMLKRVEFMRECFSATSLPAAGWAFIGTRGRKSGFPTRSVQETHCLYRGKSAFPRMRRADPEFVRKKRCFFHNEKMVLISTFLGL